MQPRVVTQLVVVAAPTNGRVRYPLAGYSSYWRRVNMAISPCWILRSRVTVCAR